MTENPFDQLGLKKDVVRYLSEQGRLDLFLKSYFRTAMSHLHPDKGGRNDLAATINAAYEEVRRHPEKVESWLHTMQNGANPEYLQVIEALTTRVEALQKVEAEHERLKEAYAQVLTGGWKAKADVRMPKAERGRRMVDFDAPVEEYDIPPVREPSRGAAAGKRRGAEREEAARERAEPRTEEPRHRKPRAPVESIVLPDLILYDAKGKPFRRYKTVTVGGEAERDEDDNYILKTQDQWIEYYRGTPNHLHSLPLLYAIIQKLHTEKHPAAAGLLADLRDSWLATSTRLDYKDDKIIHDYGTAPLELRCAIPEGDHLLNDIKKKKPWKTALQALLMPKDVEQAVEVLGDYSGVSSYIWAASKDTRRSAPLRAAFVYVVPDGLLLNCDYDLHGYGRSRRVAVVG